MTQQIESELMQKVKQGDSKSFELLVRILESPLMKYFYYMTGSKEDSEDLFQDAWIKVYEMRKKYEEGKEARSWIFIIARNICLNFLKRKRTLKQKINEIHQPVSQTQETPESSVLQADYKKAIQESLLLLPLEQREAMILRFWEQKSYSQIADIMQTSIGNVGYWISRAVETLRIKCPK